MIGSVVDQDDVECVGRMLRRHEVLEALERQRAAVEVDDHDAHAGWLHTVTGVDASIGGSRVMSPSD